jgi:hypothetical protein
LLLQLNNFYLMLPNINWLFIWPKTIKCKAIFCENFYFKLVTEI